jgi:squalene-hopene/tetraprenyl-beta-curcumene cyclase
MQSTTQALITWRQAQARTADTRWLVPIRKAEAWLTQRAKRLSDGRPADLQDVAHAIIGLSAAGRGGGDKLLNQLARVLEKAQAKDGAFSFAANGPASPYMTGQALYALRLAGRSDADSSVVKGTRWLMQKQRSDGAWSDGGFGKAEAMWAVLGLVSMDRISIDVAGLDDGTRLERKTPITASAADNGDSKVTGLEVYLDDVKVHAAKGSTLSYTLDPSGLADGMHLVDVVAKNAAGKESRRRFSFFAGDAWLTELGTRFDGGATHVGLRSLASDGQKGKVVVRVFESKEKDGAPVKGREVAVLEKAVAPGALSFAWDGKSKDGKAMQGSRFYAEVAYVDDSGKVRDSEEVLFTHDTLENQRARFGDVTGKLGLAGGGLSSNTVVELVDKRGNVVQRTTSTRSGEYRFQNVDEGEYQVRVKKKGFKDRFADIEAKPAAEAEAPAASMMAE